MSGARAPAALALLLVAFAVRAWDLGNPVIHVDEQYYLLVGDRLLHGAIPYVDVWDRKPIGLFLLFAAIRLLPGDGVLAYQLVALLAAWATAVVVGLAARATGASRRAATVAGAAYLVWIALLGGRGGQSPVFYNLPVAGAAWLTLGLPALAAAGRRGAILASGLAATTLAGVAIQLKWTPAFEGAFFGVAHLWFLRRAGARWTTLGGAAAVWLATGLLPTLLAVAWYWRHGAVDAWWFANAVSVFLRAGYPPGQLVMRLLGIATILSPLVALALLGGAGGAARRLALGWLGAALAGFLAIGTFFDHYALPLVAPLAVAAATAIDRHRRAAVPLLATGALILLIVHLREGDARAAARAVARAVAANSGRECPYVFAGDTVTYLLAHACLPTAYAFPNLLSYTTEQGATGIDEAAEVRRILARRPPVIVGNDRPLAIWNRGSLRAMTAALAHDYRPILRVPRARWHAIVWLRRDLPVRR